MVRFFRFTAFLITATLVALPAFATTTHRRTAPSSSAHAAHAHKSGVKGKRVYGKAKPKLHGQQSIASERVTEIQQALIRERYLSGEANGEWDSMTQAAMQKYQSDQGWQTRLMPDSRALKKLGLGPDYSKAINAAEASFTAPAPAASTAPAELNSGFAAAAGVNQ